MFSSVAIIAFLIFITLYLYAQKKAAEAELKKAEMNLAVKDYLIENGAYFAEPAFNDEKFGSLTNPHG